MQIGGVAMDLSSPFFPALGIPILMMLCGSFGKTLAKRTWDWRFTYLGPELALAAFSAQLAHLYDLVKDYKSLSASGGPILPAQIDPLFFSTTGTALFLGLTFLIFLGILIIHKEVEPTPSATTQQITKAEFGLLFFLANFLGAGCLTGFVLIVKLG